MALGQIHPSVPAPGTQTWLAGVHQAPPGPKACAHGASSAPCPTAHSPQAVSERGSAALQPCVPFQVGFHADPGQAAAVSTFPCHPGAGGGRDLSPVLVGVGQPGGVAQGPGVRAELGHVRGRMLGPHCPWNRMGARGHPCPCHAAFLPPHPHQHPCVGFCLSPCPKAAIWACRDFRWFIPMGCR